MAEISIVINGNKISVDAELTILEAARQAEIYIPALCHVNGSSSSRPCEVCVVEVNGESEPVRSCSVKVAKGMEITTDSDTLKEYRKQRLIQLAKTHFGDCKAPCNLTCPGQINVQGYIAHVEKGQYEEALRLIMERNPFPLSVGRVCPRFCETRCRRMLVDDPVSINHLKRFVADWSMTNDVDPNTYPENFTGKKVAIIGGGPAGLSGAFYLARKGHDVTVFEAKPQLGGMLRYGMPEYKIPRNVLGHEISTILRLGINVRFNQRWTIDFNLQDLKDQGFEAILIAIGAWTDKMLDKPGAMLPNVIPAIKFLNNLSMGKKNDYGKRAAVIGGNNIAFECARSLRRLGVEEVTVVCQRSRTGLSANQRVIREAETEGIQFLFMANPTQISEQDHGLELEYIRMKLVGKPDSRGLRKLAPVQGTTHTLSLDTVITSLGQSASGNGFGGGRLEDQLQISLKGNIKSNPRTSLTNITGIFAAGDAVSGGRTVIQAVVAARRAAENIHSFIMDLPKAAQESRFNFTRGKSFDDVSLKNFDGINTKLREKMPSRPPEICIQDFNEISLGFSEEMAKNEAARCLKCGCTAFDRCDFKKISIEHKIDPFKIGMGTIPVYAIDTSHPTIQVDLNKCIFCERCKNSCEYDALLITASGFDENGNPKGLSLEFTDKCVYCGKCVDNCSTGALNKKEQTVPVIAEQIREVKTTCPYCGAGCQLLLRIKGKTLLEVTADPKQAPNFGALCVKGRFGQNFIQHSDRLKTPLIRRNNRLVECNWDEALEFIAKKLFDFKAMFGPDSISAFSSARCTNEDNFLTQKFMRAVIGTNNVDHCARL